MSKIAIVTDSNSGITQDQAEELGVFVIPMPVIINDKTYYENVDISREKFYEKILENANVSTSQPLLGDVGKLWNNLLTTYDEIVYIPMSSKLSRSYHTSMMLSNEFDNRVHVVDNRRISVSQRQSVLDALEGVEAGMNAQEIKEILEEDSHNSSIYITVDTLHYLKKGGRITPAAAAIGTILKIKPVLQIQGDLLDSYAKARTLKNAKKIMLNALASDISNRFGDNSVENEILLRIAHTSEDKEAKALEKVLKTTFPDCPIFIDHLPLSIACHLGPGAIGVGCIKKLKIKSSNLENQKSLSHI